ncbi:MAG: helicase C-terminal domain-containing protein [Steroidobacteraceae bacterium]
MDVQGTALRLVIIEKLPFASPDDPIVKARVEHIQRHGGNPFKDYQLQEAALTLRQGGRPPHPQRGGFRCGDDRRSASHDPPLRPHLAGGSAADAPRPILGGGGRSFWPVTPPRRSAAVPA